VHSAAPPGTLPAPWNAGFPEVGWDINDFTKREVQQGHGRVVLDLQKVPLQDFFQCPHRVCCSVFFTTMKLSLIILVEAFGCPYGCRDAGLQFRHWTSDSRHRTFSKGLNRYWFIETLFSYDCREMMIHVLFALF
jgi:hypothetical protein